MPVTLPATPVAPSAEGLIGTIRKFRAALPKTLREDFDKTLQDIAAYAEGVAATEVHTVAQKHLGGLLGGAVAKGLSHTINAAIDAEVGAITAK